MRDASGLFWVSFMVKAFWGTSDGIAGDGGTKGGRLFYLFTFLPFYLLKIVYFNNFL